MNAEDIHDIRGPKFVLAPWMVLAALAALLLLAALVYGGWRWWQRRRKPRVLTPYELALARLDQLRPLLASEHAREFSIAVSDIVRAYVEQRFGITTSHSTTEEFLRDLLQHPNDALARHRTPLSAFLHQCDLVKFAGMSLTQQSMESLESSARAFVKESQLIVEEPRDALPAT